MNRFAARALFGALIALAPSALRAQHDHVASDTARGTTAHAQGAMNGMAMQAGPLGIPMTRMGSGTSWLPDASPMHAYHFMAGGWEMMLHGVAYGYYDQQNGPRGDVQWGSTNWAMLMGSHALAGGRLQLHGMFSAEPWTVSDGGYPLLLQSGETFQGQPLHDRQHPHDLFMEVAALYDRPVARNLAVSLYAAPAGEPAIGPVAYPHRPSASNDPFAPIGHHWQDATHISYGVFTAGLYSRTWKAEASIFNGREPDENRKNFDFGPLDSYAGRVFFNPNANWSFSASAAELKHVERLSPDENIRRYDVSATYAQPFGSAGSWSSALVWGANQHTGGGRLESTVLLETNVDLDAKNSVFARAEYARKSAEDLVLGASPPAGNFSVGVLALGYVRNVASFGMLDAGIGARGSINLVPSGLEPFYGSRTPTGWSVYVRLRPKAMRMEAAGHQMEGGMRMPPGAPMSQPMAHDTMQMAPGSMPGMQMPAGHDSTGTHPMPMAPPMPDMAMPPGHDSAAAHPMPMAKPMAGMEMGHDSSAMRRMQPLFGETGHDSAAYPSMPGMHHPTAGAGHHAGAVQHRRTTRSTTGVRHGAHANPHPRGATGGHGTHARSHSPARTRKSPTHPMAHDTMHMQMRRMP